MKIVFLAKTSYLCREIRHVLSLNEKENTMAKYIKKEMPDLRGTGSTQAYYRMKTWRKLEHDEFVKRCHSMHGAFERGLIDGVLTVVCEQLAYELGNGFSVKINGLGTFNAKLGLSEDKEMDGFEEGTTKRNATSIKVTGVSFRADKEMVKTVDGHCSLERGGETRLRQTRFSPAERLEMARQYLAQNGFMHVADYASLTDLSYSTASRELLRLVSDPSSGIISRGHKSSKVYLLSQQS